MPEDEEAIHPENPLEACFMDLEEADDEYLLQWALALEGQEYWKREPKFEPQNFSTRKIPPTKLSIEKVPQLDLKTMPNHLNYAFMGTNST